jgi:hypothetical protein
MEVKIQIIIIINLQIYNNIWIKRGEETQVNLGKEQIQFNIQIFWVWEAH